MKTPGNNYEASGPMTMDGRQKDSHYHGNQDTVWRNVIRIQKS